MGILKQEDLQCFNCPLPECLDRSKFCIRAIFKKEKEERMEYFNHVKMNTTLSTLPRHINHIPSNA